MASFLRRAWWTPENVSPQYEDKIKEFPTTSLDLPPTLPIIYQPRHIPSSQISTEKNKIRDRQGHTYSHSQPKDEISNYHLIMGIITLSFSPLLPHWGDLLLKVWWWSLDESSAGSEIGALKCQLLCCCATLASLLEQAITQHNNTQVPSKV